MTTIKIELSPSALKHLGDDIVIKIDGNGTMVMNKETDEHCKLFAFMQQTIDRLRDNGNVRTSETYTCTLNSFKRYRKYVDIEMGTISSDMMEGYESWLKKQHLSMNSVSFYMRILRAVYNRAVEQGKVDDLKPFRNVYTGIGKTIKRAISRKDLEKIKNSEIGNIAMKYARDLFMLSFYLRGMSFVDMANLKKADLRNGILTYRRKKTGQTLRIKWKSCMQEILDRNPPLDNIHLLPIVNNREESMRRQYQTRQCYVNSNLKRLSSKLGIECNLTMYVTRHSWASIAKEMDIPVSVICDGMGHNSEKTTQIYLKSIDANKIDDANDRIISEI